MPLPLTPSPSLSKHVQEQRGLGGEREAGTGEQAEAGGTAPVEEGAVPQESCWTAKMNNFIHNLQLHADLINMSLIDDCACCVHMHVTIIHIHTYSVIYTHPACIRIGLNYIIVH